MHKVLHFLGRDFTYYEQFTREKLPLLFIFHGAGYNKSPAKFKDERFNVVSLMDTFGFGGKGSWYLGQDGDIFWIDALKFLLEKLKNDYQTDTVYFWGSSMGGYAALLHGYINKVTAVYANVPQTYLLGSTYIKHGKVDNISMNEIIENILLSPKSNFNDLRNIFTEKVDTVFF